VVSENSRFEWLLAPISLETFISAHLDDTPLMIKRRAIEYYAEIFSSTDFSTVLQQKTDVRGIRKLRIDPVAGTSEQAVVDVDARDLSGWSRAAFRAGYSVAVDSVDQSWVPLGRLASSIESSLLCRANVNAYLTPPDRQAFPVHKDFHDVAIMQVFGRKRWSVWDRQNSSSAPTPPFEHAPARICEVLEPGDLLYLPRGFAHQAIGTEVPSLHLTIGFHPYTWRDAMKDVIDELAETEGVLQQHVRSAHDFAANFHEAATIILGAIDANISRTRLPNRRVDQLKSKRPTSHHAAWLADTVEREVIHANTLVRRRHYAACQAQIEDSSACLVLPDGTRLLAPLGALPALNFVVESESSFQVSDLPGALTRPAKIVIATRLKEEGVIEVLRSSY
jgi:ribosomal protein L16 Arg81 hydroxylase